jgi:hypothetical protein
LQTAGWGTQAGGEDNSNKSSVGWGGSSWGASADAWGSNDNTDTKDDATDSWAQQTSASGWGAPALTMETLAKPSTLTTPKEWFTKPTPKQETGWKPAFAPIAPQSLKGKEREQVQTSPIQPIVPYSATLTSASQSQSTMQAGEALVSDRVVTVPTRTAKEKPNNTTWADVVR